MNLKEQLNSYGSAREPFLFIIDYKLNNYEVILLKDLPSDIKYSINQNKTFINHKTKIEKNTINFKEYKIKFDLIQDEIKAGNTYLLNLTTQTQINTQLQLNKIYDIANAKFKLYYKDKFICFSPERFCEIKNNKIYTYPMKGTIDANIENAKVKILENKKELAEHIMVVDLLRNDLSIVSKKVKVEKFRYCEKIKAGQKELLQVSSKISGQLNNNWQDEIGDIITTILPAGSITGAPKKKTIEIIEKIEQYDRGYFTGIFGVFDGVSLDSAVMIRYIEKLKNNKLVYKSGGGITYDSDPKDEYNEMIDKVYIP